MLLVTTWAHLSRIDINQAHQSTNSQKARLNLKTLSIRKRIESQSAVVLLPITLSKNTKIFFHPYLNLGFSQKQIMRLEFACK